MKDTILLVGHGSRGPDGNREIEEFARQWRQRRGEEDTTSLETDSDIDIALGAQGSSGAFMGDGATRDDRSTQVCFIEFAEVLLDEGLSRAARSTAARGDKRVIVVPLILNAADHVKKEIPEHIAQARIRYPEVEFLYAPHLGVCDPILAILERYLDKAMRELDVPDPKTTGVILLARGSSDRMANGDVAQMARWLFETAEHELVDIAFTGVTHPRLERVVQRQVRLGMMQIIVLPYYLFTGRLIERIERQVINLQQQYPQVRFARGGYFGFEEEIFRLVERRIERVIDN
uniref:Sirohydrochlorin cobaltochelatase n=1 Tax=Candidatus Kentrum sp. LFY TaxID=2126342 RepID=A0A450UBC7_9GAMM|nr:MAG: sirohydrochlorin cobaltochelatase [Candidatus Kentron sp. LFY]VFJ89435.1 MAG: sirohydrochlorin cobaltochelatase [Candidatus Kentron sp. LFY]